MLRIFTKVNSLCLASLLPLLFQTFLSSIVSLLSLKMYGVKLSITAKKAFIKIDIKREIVLLAVFKWPNEHSTKNTLLTRKLPQ